MLQLFHSEQRMFLYIRVYKIVSDYVLSRWRVVVALAIFFIYLQISHKFITIILLLYCFLNKKIFK